MLSKLKHYPWSLLTPTLKFKYFKRELLGGGYSYRLDKLLPDKFHQWIPIQKNVMPISFSIPEEKINENYRTERTKDFPLHIVDQEIATSLNIKPNSYQFSSEIEYYNDLKQSRFGITTKRGGWDCLRHYELAANGCVLCFKDLNLKPVTCAPHGLSEANCIIYKSLDDLKYKISSINEEKYLHLQNMTYKWIRNNSTLYRAKEFLNSSLNNER